MLLFIPLYVQLFYYTFVHLPVLVLYRLSLNYKFTVTVDLMNCVISQVANEVIGEMNLKPEEVLLAQGTLRPDLIESASHLASGKAEVIKTHHNDTELIRKLRDEVLLHMPVIIFKFCCCRVWT